MLSMIPPPHAHVSASSRVLLLDLVGVELVMYQLPQAALSLEQGCRHDLLTSVHFPRDFRGQCC